MAQDETEDLNDPVEAPESPEEARRIAEQMNALHERFLPEIRKRVELVIRQEIASPPSEDDLTRIPQAFAAMVTFSERTEQAGECGERPSEDLVKPLETYLDGGSTGDPALDTKLRTQADSIREEMLRGPDEKAIVEEIDRETRELTNLFVVAWLDLLILCARDGVLHVNTIDDAMIPAAATPELLAGLFGQQGGYLDEAASREILAAVRRDLSDGQKLPPEAVEIIKKEVIVV